MKKVLIVSIAFSPNLGGIETHFDDLTKALTHRNWRVTLLTYKPITANISAKFHEFKYNQKLEIFRIPWFGNLFFKLVHNPILEFLYLMPGLFIGLPILLILKSEIRIIHSHGLVAGFVSVFWGKLFNKKVITTTHSIYNFPKSGLYKNFAKFIFSSSDRILTLSKQSKREIANLGVDKQKITTFTYWVNQNNFKKTTRTNSKFNILFVGRLIEEKGLKILLKAATKWNKNIYLTIAGTGPLSKITKKYSRKYKNINYLGRVAQSDLPSVYTNADSLIVPSIHEEGFGRVIIESLSCGTPVIGSNRGAIPEAIDESVGKLININQKNIIKTVNYYYKNKKELAELKSNTTKFAMKKYSEKNVDVIIDSYEK